MSGTPDGPGRLFYYNAYDLPSRPPGAWRRSTSTKARRGTTSRSAWPQENEALPNFMRFGGNTAYVEGWALYAETLWDELGMETDPYQRFGGLNDEMLRAMRLVVDTGIHAKGWTREQAIRYMLDNSGLPETDVTAEVERYIAIPGQALAYKVGQLKILELRARAEQALGSRLRHSRLSRPGAEQRLAPAHHPGAQDRRLDRAQKGRLRRKPFRPSKRPSAPWPIQPPIPRSLIPTSGWPEPWITTCTGNSRQGSPPPRPTGRWSFPSPRWAATRKWPARWAKISA
jgi:hypothetical protein